MDKGQRENVFMNKGFCGMTVKYGTKKRFRPCFHVKCPSILKFVEKLGYNVPNYGSRLRTEKSRSFRGEACC